MRRLPIAVFPVVLIWLAGCSSPQDRAYSAQEKIHKERLQLVDDYKECLKKAGDDKQKTEACDQYLKAAEALK